MDPSILFYDIDELNRYQKRQLIILGLLAIVFICNIGVTAFTLKQYGCYYHKVACPVTAISLTMGLMVLIAIGWRLYKLRHAIKKPWYSKSLMVSVMFYIVSEIIRAVIIFPAYYLFNQLERIIFITQAIIASTAGLALLIGIIGTFIVLTYKRCLRPTGSVYAPVQH